MTFKQKILCVFPNAIFEIVDHADGYGPSICPITLGEREACPPSRDLNVHGLDELCNKCWELDYNDEKERLDSKCVELRKQVYALQGELDRMRRQKQDDD